MLQELINIAGTSRFEEFGRLDLKSASWDRGDLVLEFSLAYENVGAADSVHWSITCSSVTHYTISRAVHCGLNHHKDDHPALLQYTEPFESLYFSAAARRPEELLGRLLTAHHSATDDWIDFGEYLNSSLTIADLIRSDDGLLAEAPSFLVEAYAAVLEAEGMKPRRIASEAGTYVPDAEMIHFGNSFVIASGFSAELRSK
ncbi:MAG: hypothetical protein K0U72_04580 [Gammaproteobacteria bacterium]|nr:hypothetical protein [Gammaproteobacteria bacterium]